jgi:hypothetical protein
MTNGVSNDQDSKNCGDNCGRGAFVPGAEQMTVLVPPKEQLERMHPTNLAVICERVAEDAFAYPEGIVQKASNLKLQWTQLQARPDPDLAKQKKINAKKEYLRKRMVEFLDGIH